MPTTFQISQMSLQECVRADEMPYTTQGERTALRRRAFKLRVDICRERISQKIAAAKPGDDVSGLENRLAEYDSEFPREAKTDNGSG